MHFNPRGNDKLDKFSLRSLYSKTVSDLSPKYPLFLAKTHSTNPDTDCKHSLCRKNEIETYNHHHNTIHTSNFF